MPDVGRSVDVEDEFDEEESLDVLVSLVVEVEVESLPIELESLCGVHETSKIANMTAKNLLFLINHFP